MTKFIYGTSSIRLPECFIIKSLSREAWNKESNWLGYIAVATDEGKGLLGRRDIVVAWRGTIQLYEWANDFDFPLESAVTVFPQADPNNTPRIANGWLSLYTTTDPRSRFDNTSAREQVLTSSTLTPVVLVSYFLYPLMVWLCFWFFSGSRRAQKAIRIVQR